MSGDGENILVILSLSSGVGKTTLTKRYPTKNINPSKILFPTPQDLQDLTR